MPTKRRIPTPVRIDFASGIFCQINMKARSLSNPCPETYKANAIFERPREGVEEINGGVETVCQPFVTTLRLIVHLNLLFKHEENSIGRVAGPELSGEWVGIKILFCTFFVSFQGTNDY